MAKAMHDRLPETAAEGHGPAEAGRLFEEYSDRILAYCTRCLRSQSDAEDAMQTTFLYAYRALGRGVVPESEYAWLRSIATNVCRWQQRTTARRGHLSSATELDSLPAVGSSDADDRELLMELEGALASIPAGQRRALLLREWQGLSSSEVATQLGMSAPATYALLTRARQSLARALTAAPRRPMLSLNFGPLLLKMKGLVGGSAANVAATTAVVATVAVGGVVVERAVHGRDDTPRAPATTPSIGTGAPASQDGRIAPARRGSVASTTVAGAGMADSTEVESPGSSTDPAATPAGPPAGEEETAAMGPGSASPASEQTDPQGSSSPARESSPAPGETEPEPVVEVPDLELPPVPELVPDVLPLPGETDDPLEGVTSDPTSALPIPDPKLPDPPSLP